MVGYTFYLTADAHSADPWFNLSRGKARETERVQRSRKESQKKRKTERISRISRNKGMEDQIGVYKKARGFETNLEYAKVSQPTPTLTQVGAQNRIRASLLECFRRV